MSYEEICRAVERIREKYGTMDPVKLCEAMRIILIPQSFGTAPDAIKGFFIERFRVKTITVNGDLPLVLQRIVIMHEIGHAVLHRKKGIYAFHDVTMFDGSSVMEKEANLFAAEYLLGDEDVVSCLNADSTFFSAASELMVPMELLDFKFRVMKWKGYKLCEPPVMSRSNFLRDVEVPYNADNHIC